MGREREREGMTEFWFIVYCEQRMSLIRIKTEK